MNAERRGDGGRAIKRSRPSRGAARSTAALLGVGFLVGVLIVSALWVGSVSAAARVVDVPCEICGAASDPVQFSFMVRLEDSESGSGAVSAIPFAIADASDPIQYTFAARRSANLARDAEIARLRGLTGPGAGTRARFDESVHLRALAEAALTGSSRADCATLISPTRSQLAEAARLTGLAERYLDGQLGLFRVASRDRSRLTDAARLTGLAAHLGMRSNRVSPGLACLVGP